MVNLDLKSEMKEALDEMMPVIVEELAKTVKAVLDEKLLTVVEAGELLSCSPGAVRKMIERGRIPSTRIGRSVRVKRSTLLGEVNHDHA